MPTISLTIRYFAAARELCACDEERIELSGTELGLQAVMAALCEHHPRLRPYAGRMRLAVNGEFASADARVADGDEVSVLPPVAGGSGAPSGGLTAACEVRKHPLSLDEAVAAVRHAGAGGIAIFMGIVRDQADGKDVARLDYEAHDQMAVREMARVLAEVMAELPGTRLSAQHRVGQLAVGDAAVIIAASAPHRDEAFRACRAAIDRIKERVPIWKKEWAPDGSANWVNLGSGDEP